MIEKLTKEQEEAIVPFREKWKARILVTEQTDEEIIKGVQNIYKEAGFKKPEVYFMDSPLGSQIFANIIKNLKLEKTEIIKNIWSNIWSNIKSNIGLNISSNIKSNIGLNIRSNIWSNIRSNIESNIGLNISSDIKSNIGSNIRSNIWSNIWSNIESNIGLNIRSNIESNIESNIRSNNLEFFVFSSNDATWCHWYIYQKYYFDNGLLKKDKYSRKLDKYLNSVIDTWMCLYFDGIAIVSRKPKVRLNVNGFLHSDEFPAVEFKDGYKLYYLNGVSFKEELWRKVVSHSMSLKEVMEIVDIDQRTQAMKYVDVKELIKEFDGKTLSTYQKFTIDGKQVDYSLVMIPKNDKLFTVDSYHAVYSCPSTDKVYMSGIDPKIGIRGDIAECMAWKAKMDIESWKLLVPLQTES
jgi:citrate lyase gamma subunit